jgi:hypothetical protein
LLFFFILFIYAISSPGATPYDYFTRLSASMLEGRIYLAENPPWLNELIPINGKYFVAYPPMPAILAIPFVAIFKDFQQQILAHVIGAAIAIVTYKTTLLITKDFKKALWMSLLAAFGNVIWFLSSVGSSWYLGQLSAALFLSLAIWETFYKKRPILIGFLLGAAYLSRVHTILSILFFIFILSKKPFMSKINFKKIFLLSLGLAPFLVFNALYNLARFGVLWDKGYMLIPGVLEEPWYQLGLVHPSYVSRHLELIFKALPVFKNEFPYVFPSWGGLAIWITTPAFFLLLKAPLKSKTVRLSILASTLVAIPILMHGTTGFAQFGYRFLVDFIPFLFLILIFALPKKLTKTHWILLFLSILVNAWGVVWINKLGWVI